MVKHDNKFSKLYVAYVAPDVLISKAIKVKQKYDLLITQKNYLRKATQPENQQIVWNWQEYKRYLCKKGRYEEFINNYKENTDKKSKDNTNNLNNNEIFEVFNPDFFD